MSIPERAQHNAIVEFFDITLVRRSYWDGHTSNCKCLSQTGQGNEELTNGFCALYVWHKQLLYERELSRVTCNFLNQEVYARTLSSPSFRQLGTAGGRLINPLDRRRIGLAPVIVQGWEYPVPPSAWGHQLVGPFLVAVSCLWTTLIATPSSGRFSTYLNNITL